MKKILLTTAILLLAAACNKQAQVQPVQNQPAPTAQAVQTQPTPTSVQQSATTTQTSEGNYVISNSTKPGWKVYTNFDSDFLVEYPATWVIDSGLDGVSFTDWTGDQWMFGVEVDSASKTLQQASQVSKSSLQYDTGLYATLEQKSVNIDGESAIQNFYKAPQRGDYYGDTQTFVIHDGKLYTISEGYGADPKESAMLKSFKFTN